MDNTAGNRISREVTGWPGVTTEKNDRNGEVFTHGRVELGHLHGNTMAHLPFPRRIRDLLIAEGRVTPHPVMPNSGWSERRMTSDRDVEDVIALFRVNYDRVHARDSTPATAIVASAAEETT